MLTLIEGYEKCGKSEYAEDLLWGRYGRNYYIAAMRVMDEEGRKRVEAHREKRKGKGFITIEEETDLQRALRCMKAPEECGVLLECAANLLANYIFELQMSCEMAVDRAFEEIVFLEKRVKELCVVCSLYPEKEEYDRATRDYIKAIEDLRHRLEEMAETVISFDGGFAENRRPGSDFFENRACSYYPCHSIDEPLNCLFCYCPMYFLEKCPGNPEYRESEKGRIKLCTNCTYPHRRKNYPNIMKVLKANL